MKKILIYGLSALGLMFAVSCSDLLEEESYVEVGKNNYVNNAEEAETVLMGIYKDLANEYMYSYHLSLLFTISSDIAQCEGSATTSFREIPTNSHNPSTSQIMQTWQKLYSSIYEANDFIETVSARMGSWSSSNRELATIYLGEAHALRALFYFELVRWYGNIVLITSTEQSSLPATEYVQADPKDVYAFIESDLKYAAEVLPWAVDDTKRSSNAYRMSKGAALGLLAKVYCTWAGYPVRDESKWAEAAKVARQVIESGKHRLIPDYETVWSNTCNGIWDAGESLIEVSFYSPTSLDSDQTAGRIGKWNGVVADAVEGQRGRNAANWKVVYTFTREWETHNDPRMALSIADYKYDSSKGDGPVTYISTVTNPTEDNLNKQRQLYTPAKWDTEKYVNSANYMVNNDKSCINWYILRYSDVLLLFAEALNESGGSIVDAVDAVNAVRRRGFGDSDHDLSYGLSREALREAIRKERAYELCFEGHRKQDLIRWGIYYQTIRNTAQELVNWFSNANYTVARFTIEGRHELLPIPQRDLDLMTQCKQNPGWGE
ncbi:RagB/SusD family nutrient uptake outer membrane protein [Alistipes sp. An116]|uniref:RagB/SusD family nutrient uptake outer membrane protein n=1 Tax=Alistipes sp. An116 TaxID=1965546 RepID=UPI000B37A42B|nr:RagB/SusD family nutrient uptake outer membrane protein [Alistipes sp. An116]OUQ54502.1 RagB/SusD family nutrient uptake outer membrane protein [Alistipes sp. An116]